VQVGDTSLPREFFELSNRGDANDFLHVVADPQGDRGTPVSISGNVPITGVLQPRSESIFTHVRRNPSGLFVVRDKLFLNFGDSDEP
jgi:hypothetical protein